MMRRILVGAFIIAAILMLDVKALYAEENAPPQEAAESEEINPKLWYTLATVAGRAELFTHWERVHPHSILPGAAAPRIYSGARAPRLQAWVNRAGTYDTLLSYPVIIFFAWYRLGSNIGYIRTPGNVERLPARLAARGTCTTGVWR